MNGYLIAGVLVAIIVLLLATNKKLVETVKNMYKIEELRKRIFYTIGLLLVYRLGCFVVIPGINPNMLGADSALADQMNSNSLLGLLDVFSGGAFANAAILALGVMPYITASIIIVLIALPRFKLVQKLNDQINRVTRENLTGINVVHAFNAEDYQNEKFEGPNHQMMKTQMKNQRLFAILMPMMGLGMNGLSLCIYWLGALLLNNIPLTNFPGRLTMFSDIVVFSTYAGFVILSFMLLIMVFVMFPGAQVSAGRINEVLNTHANIKEGDKTQGSETGTVEFRNVSFSYPGTSEKQLSNISFKVNKG